MHEESEPSVASLHTLWGCVLHQGRKEGARGINKHNKHNIQQHKQPQTNQQTKQPNTHQPDSQQHSSQATNSHDTQNSTKHQATQPLISQLGSNNPTPDTQATQQPNHQCTQFASHTTPDTSTNHQATQHRRHHTTSTITNDHTQPPTTITRARSQTLNNTTPLKPTQTRAMEMTKGMVNGRRQ